MQESHAGRDCSPAIEPEPFCYAKEAVKVTPLKLRAFHERVKKGDIPSYKFGRARYFRKSEVAAAIEKTRVGTRDEVLR